MSPAPNQLPIEWVSKTIMRSRFNNGQYTQEVHAGKLLARIKKNSRPDTPPPGEPFCTHSQIGCYHALSRELVAIVHQYRRPDGTLGASGLPDPKRLTLADRIVSVRSKG